MLFTLMFRGHQVFTIPALHICRWRKQLLAACACHITIQSFLAFLSGCCCIYSSSSDSSRICSRHFRSSSHFLCCCRGEWHRSSQFSLCRSSCPGCGLVICSTNPAPLPVSSATIALASRWSCGERLGARRGRATVTLARGSRRCRGRRGRRYWGGLQERTWVAEVCSKVNCAASFLGVQG